MSRLNAESVLARARDLLDGYRPRSFLEATDPRCDDYEPPALPPVQVRAMPTPAPALSLLDADAEADDGVHVTEGGEIASADLQMIVAVFCPRCTKRALWPEDAYRTAPRFHQCGRCRAVVELPKLPAVAR